MVGRDKIERKGKKHKDEIEVREEIERERGKQPLSRAEMLKKEKNYGKNSNLDFFYFLFNSQQRLFLEILKIHIILLNFDTFFESWP